MRIDDISKFRNGKCPNCGTMGYLDLELDRHEINEGILKATFSCQTGVTASDCYQAMAGIDNPICNYSETFTFKLVPGVKINKGSPLETKA